MRITQSGNDIILSEAADFDLYQTFECGQCFRWDKTGDDEYTGVALGRALTVKKIGDDFILYNTTAEDFQNIWYDYFDFGNDYSKIKDKLRNDEVMKTAISYGEGIRILRQDLWETVVSFIISASNNIPRIKKIIAAFCNTFGERITYGGKEYSTFPTPEKTAQLSLEDIAVIKAGFRDKYILDAARFFVSGEADMLKQSDNQSAKKCLMSIKGVGNKVADCVMLFGLSRYDSFPVDVWIKRIMEYCYFENKQSISNISEFASEKFGELGGFAQQYLFFYARENKIEGEKN